MGNNTNPSSTQQNISADFPQDTQTNGDKSYGDAFFQVYLPSCIEGEVWPTSFHANESLNQLFRYRLTLVSNQAQPNINQLLGLPIKVHLSYQNSNQRWFHGLVSEVKELGVCEQLGYRRFRLSVKPRASLLTHNRDQQFYPNTTLKTLLSDILKPLDSDYTNSNQLHADDIVLPHKTRYQQSHWDFIESLLANYGWYYRFSHDENTEQLVLGNDGFAFDNTTIDSIVSGKTGTADQAAVSQLQHQYKRHASRYQCTYYTPLQPEKLQQYSSGETRQSLQQNPDAQIDEFPAWPTANKEQLNRLSRHRVDSLRAAQHSVNGSSNCMGFNPGETFTPDSSSRPEDGGQCMVTEVYHQAQSSVPWQQRNGQTDTPRHSYKNSFKASRQHESLRSTLPTPPKRSGHHSAWVKGITEQHPAVDTAQNSAIHFRWDTHANHQRNARLLQTTAGDGYGGQMFPRAGDEVLSQFLDGDIDEPIAVGSVYHQDHPPIYPTDTRARTSGWQGQSLREGGAKHTPNQWSMDDTPDAENVLHTASKDYSGTIKDNTYHHITQHHWQYYENDSTRLVQQAAAGVSAQRLRFKVGSSELDINQNTIRVQAADLQLLTQGGGDDLQVARLDDDHDCPDSGHDGGPITAASATVFTNNIATARLNDPLNCTGVNAEDVIQDGSPTTFVDTLPVARLTDPTEHGGEITSASPDVRTGSGIGTALNYDAPLTTHTCQARWQKIGESLLPITQEQDPIVRNKAINARYADYYQRNPDIHWAGVGAFASKQVGCSMEYARHIAEQNLGTEDVVAYGAGYVSDAVKARARDTMNALMKEAIDLLSERVENLLSQYSKQALKQLVFRSDFMARIKGPERGTPLDQIPDHVYRSIGNNMDHFMAKGASPSQLTPFMLQSLQEKPDPSDDEKKFISDLAQYSYEQLADGNLLVFEQVMPFLLFYEEYGLENLKACTDCCKEKNISIAMIEAFELIEAGEIDDGNAFILEYEQKNILQPTIYSDILFRSLIISNSAADSTQIGRHFGAQAVNVVFDSACSGTPEVIFHGWDLGNYEQRKHFTDRVMQEFRSLLKSKESAQLIDEELNLIKEQSTL